MTITVTEADLKRWKGHRGILLRVLADLKIHDRATLASATNSQNLTARISELRKAGWLIECEVYRRDDTVHTYYQLAGYTGDDNTQARRHCQTCRCK